MPIDWWPPMRIPSDASIVPISSVTRQYADEEKPYPPYSSGIVMPNAPSSARPRMTSAGTACSRSMSAGRMWSFAKPRKESRNVETISRSAAPISGNGNTVSSGICPAKRDLTTGIRRGSEAVATAPESRLLMA